MEALLSPVQLAAMLGISVQTIYNRRARGESMPTCVKLGGLVRYHPDDVRAWLSRQSEVTAPGRSASARFESDANDDVPKRRGRPTKTEQLRRRHDGDRLTAHSIHHQAFSDLGECQRRPPMPNRARNKS